MVNSDNGELWSYSQKNLLYLKQSMRKFKPKGTLENNGDFDGKQLKGDR